MAESIYRLSIDLRGLRPLEIAHEWLTFVDCKTHLLLVTENLVIGAETETLIKRQTRCIETDRDDKVTETVVAY